MPISGSPLASAVNAAQSVASFKGLPPLSKQDLANFAPAIAYALVDGAGLPQTLAGPIWGIFDASGNPVIAADTVLGVEYLNEWRISDYPQEDGAFASYNKVATPFDVRMRFACGGTQAAREAFLAQVTAAAGSLDLYNAVTPEAVYANANIVHTDYRRETRNGATLIVVDVWLQEVRQAAPAQYSQVKTPDAADSVSQGQIQATAPSQSLLAQIGQREFQ